VFDGDGQTLIYSGGQWMLDPDDLNGIDDDNWDNNASTYIDDLVGWEVSGGTYGDNNPNPPGSGGWSHGTHVAGLLSATSNNNTGIASTAFNCSILPVKCTADDEDNNYISNGFEGIMYAAQAGYNAEGFVVINCSWGGVGYNLFEQATINTIYNNYNAVIFVACSNKL
jgi:subtilisin family serine protease